MFGFECRDLPIRRFREKRASEPSIPLTGASLIGCITGDDTDTVQRRVRAHHVTPLLCTTVVYPLYTR
ncbi:hypothetical protein IEQ34_020187 [Dendrobium chrysotoxum]|uniref:Uncharacterized protein n=1 Tax=Dendrobium chrysotoxum TaxID=161865 RepID=A0AAV7G1D6_DENCH|nr:hypothetical protein IEQ34_020187 [Dendrobium chrysotoxum]